MGHLVDRATHLSRVESGGAVAGVAVGGFICVFLMFLLLWLPLHRRRKTRRPAALEWNQGLAESDSRQISTSEKPSGNIFRAVFMDSRMVTKNQ